jgi:PleD family two-component response regulator
VAATQDCGYNLATLLAAADDAMYSAKRAGRNRVEMHRTTGRSATVA